MNIKIFFSVAKTTALLQSKLGKSKNLLTLLLLLSFGISFGQYQKLDYKFEKLIQESKALSKSPDGPRKLSTLAKELQVDEQLVVTAKGAQKMYSCIVYTDHPEELKRNGIIVQSTLPKFVTVLATLEDLQKMVEMPNVISILSPAFDELHNDVSLMQSGANLLQNGALNDTNYTGEGVLVGIFDTGIDWKHPDFRDAKDPTKSRIVSIWDQTLTPISGEVSPANFENGVEYTMSQINDEIDGTPTNFVRQKDINGHGTHVAATAAGNGAAFADKRHRGFAPNAGLVIVKGGDGSFAQNNTIDAMTYFQQVATAQNKAIVFNMSIGGQGSAHDGTAPHEVAVDKFTRSGPGRVAVISAGNDYGRNLHRKVIIAPNSSGTFSISAGSSTTEDNVFSVYMYGDSNLPVTAKLISPEGIEYLSPPGQTTEHEIQGGKFLAKVYNYISAANQKRYVQVVITRKKGSIENSSGFYSIILANNESKQMVFHGYKVSEGAAATLLGGDNEYIVASPGNATTAITVASYIGRLGWYKSNPTAGGYITLNSMAEGISPFSAKGPRTDEVLKPEITASGQSVISAMSSDALLDASSSSNVDGTFYKINQGTSMSAPGVAGAVALLLQANPKLTAVEVKTMLTKNARHDEVTGNVPNARWGFGKLDIYKTVADEIGCQTSDTETIGYDNQFYTRDTDTQVTGKYIFAVRYSPTLTGKLGSVNFHTGLSAPTDTPIIISIRTVVDGKPGTVLASKTINSLSNDIQRLSWNSIDFTQFNVPIVTGDDFYVTIDATAGSISLRADETDVDKRSYTSKNNGITWLESSNAFRIRAMVYEDQPQIKQLATKNESVPKPIAMGKNYVTTSCNIIASVEKTESSTITGNVTAKVWLTNSEKTHVSRRYELTPTTNPSTATGRVTLYYYQSEFDVYNETNSVKLPTSPTDEQGKANILIDQFAGTSSDNSGKNGSYTNGHVTLKPNVENVKWNPTYQYWEVTLDVTGFGGFFLRTSSSTLATSDITKDQIAIYPNPVKDVLNIDLKSQTGNVKIFDLSGKVVRTDSIKKSGTINVSTLTKGMYIVEISTDDNSKVTKKIIKE